MAKKPSSRQPKLIIGWREWCSLPDLGLPGVLAKIDTGAKTSSLHAFRIRPFTRNGEHWVNFAVHPLQRRRRPELVCEAPLVDERKVTSSNGTSEFRPVISTRLILGCHEFVTEITLTNRDEMGCRMLVGRQSLKKRFLVDSALSCTLGTPNQKTLYTLSKQPAN